MSEYNISSVDKLNLDSLFENGNTNIIYEIYDTLMRKVVEEEGENINSAEIKIKMKHLKYFVDLQKEIDNYFSDNMDSYTEAIKLLNTKSIEEIRKDNSIKPEIKKIINDMMDIYTTGYTKGIEDTLNLKKKFSKENSCDLKFFNNDIYKFNNIEELLSQLFQSVSDIVGGCNVYYYDHQMHTKINYILPLYTCAIDNTNGYYYMEDSSNSISICILHSDQEDKVHVIIEKIKYNKRKLIIRSEITIYTYTDINYIKLKKIDENQALNCSVTEFYDGVRESYSDHVKINFAFRYPTFFHRSVPYTEEISIYYSDCHNFHKSEYNIIYFIYKKSKMEILFDKPKRYLFLPEFGEYYY